ncbi:porin family protein [Aquiflexum sp.]|uniref:porin family protein n=1 Tax=Aquiflexum sp. TaxID=1872584 RepID=UPI0035940EF4
MRYLLIIVGLIIFQPGYGQLSKGIKAGLSASTIEINEIRDGSVFKGGESVTGYHAGVFARHNMGMFFIQPEIIFTSSGGKINVTPPQNSTTMPNPYDLEITYNKIDVPILVGIKIANLIRFQAGPTGSYLLSSEQKNSATGAITDVLANYNQFSVAYQAGVGLDLDKFTLDLRFEDNLSDFGDKVGNFNTDQRNKQFLLSIGMIF